MAEGAKDRHEFTGTSGHMVAITEVVVRWVLATFFPRSVAMLCSSKSFVLLRKCCVRYDLCSFFTKISPYTDKSLCIFASHLLSIVQLMQTRICVVNPENKQQSTLMT